MFSGTSSATPIVASCVIVLQSYYFSLTGKYLTGKQMRDILVNTGIPQGGSKHIGPLPNMKNALEAIDNLQVCLPPTDLSIETDETCVITITWKHPENKTDFLYNIYKDDILIVENYSDTSYSETIDFEEVFEWCVEKVCFIENSEKVCLQNEPCNDVCQPPTALSIETNEECLVSIFWERLENITDFTFNIYKNEALIEENYSDTSYSETIDFEEMFEWCIETVCEHGNSEKKCITNEICPVSIHEINTNDIYTFFPNPMYDKLFIRSKTRPLPDAKIELLNVNGSVISVHNFTENEVIISLEGAPSGIYFINILNGNQQHTQKIIKM
jgi:hypothetical protein